MSDFERRQLEVERRIQRLGDLILQETLRSDMLLAGAEKLSKMYELVWNYPPWFGGYNGCHDVPSSTPDLSKYGAWTPRPMYSSSGPTWPAGKGCGWSDPVNIATPDHAALIYKYVVKMTYRGVTSIVASYEYTCAGWVIDAKPVTIPNINVWDPVSFTWEYSQADPAMVIMQEKFSDTTNFRWFDKDGLTTKPYWLGGKVQVAVDASTPLSGDDGPYYYGSDDGWGKCVVGNYLIFQPGGMRGYPKLKLTSSAEPVETRRSVGGRFTMEFVGGECTIAPPSAKFEQIQREISLEVGRAIVAAFVGTTLSFGSAGDQCTPFLTYGNGTTVEKDVAKANARFIAEGGSVKNVAGGRWELDEKKVGQTKCEVPGSIYEKILSRAGLGKTGDVFMGTIPTDITACGFQIRTMWGPLDAREQWYNASFSGQCRPLKEIPVGYISPGSSYTFSDDTTPGKFLNWINVRIGNNNADMGGCSVVTTWKVTFP